MQFIKYSILFLIFILSILIGKYIANRYIFRLKELEEIKNALNIFKSKIKFTYEPIPEIFEEISMNTSSNISYLFINAKEKMKNETAAVAWEETIDDFSGNLNNEDKQVIKTLSKLLRGDRYWWAIKPNRSNRKLFRRTN